MAVNIQTPGPGTTSRKAKSLSTKISSVNFDLLNRSNTSSNNNEWVSDNGLDLVCKLLVNNTNSYYSHHCVAPILFNLKFNIGEYLLSGLDSPKYVLFTENLLEFDYNIGILFPTTIHWTVLITDIKREIVN